MVISLRRLLAELWRSPSTRLARRASRLMLEELEPRTVPSTVPLAVPLDAHASIGPATSPGTLPGGFSPVQIEDAYRVSPLLNAGTDGAGQTIGIVVAYNDPNIIGDANAFNETFNKAYNPSYKGYDLPLFNQGDGGPTLSVVNQTGGSTLPSHTDAIWTLEASLDVEWAHAIAPKANILLVETSSSFFNDLFTGVRYAAQQASIVSMSWGAQEASVETSFDHNFTDFPNVTFVASAGDSGGVSYYPSASPYVLSVGGTSLTVLGKDNKGSHYGGESAWVDGGGGPSPYEGLPSYQDNIAISQSYAARTTPDVSIVGDRSTGLAIYDSTPINSPYVTGTTPWLVGAGTSIGSPLWSGIVALADQAHGSPLNTAQVHNALYSLASNPVTYSQSFHDITTGSNGYPATTGYDLATGLGTPKVHHLANFLADSVGPSTITVGPAPSAAANALAYSTASSATVTALAGISGGAGSFFFGYPLYTGEGPSLLTGSNTTAVVTASASVYVPASSLYAAALAGTPGDASPWADSSWQSGDGGAALADDSEAVWSPPLQPASVAKR